VVEHRTPAFMNRASNMCIYSLMLPVFSTKVS